MGKKCTFVRMTSEHSKQVQARRVYKKRDAKKILQKYNIWKNGW